MALSQVGEYLEELEDVVPIVRAIVAFINNENPMIRYAVCHAIGQISDDMRPQFQHKFHAELMPILLPLLKDPIPRVVTHVGAALVNFVDGMSKDHINPYLKDLLGVSINYINERSSIVKESFLGLISSLVEAAGSDFNPFFEEVTNILFKIF